MSILGGRSRRVPTSRERQRTFAILGGATTFTLVCFAIFLNDVVNHHSARIVLGVYVVSALLFNTSVFVSGYHKTHRESS